MKLSRLAIFVFFAYQTLFFNLWSMEDQDIIEGTTMEDQLVEENPDEQQKKQSIIILKKSNIENNSDLKTLRFHSQNDDTSIYKGDFFIGEFPPGSINIVQSLQNFNLIRKMFPLLIKISGPEFSGKTTLVRHFVQEINCTKSQFLEIGSLNDIDEIKETLKSQGIMLNQFPSEIIKKKNEPSETNKKKNHKLKDIEAIIEVFYKQKAIQRQPYIINFTKGLKLTTVGYRTLREAIKKIQQDKIAPLMVFFESRSNGSSDNFHFFDEVIHIFPPTPKDIIAILTYTFKINGYGCEAIKPEILAKLQPAAHKRHYSPPQIIRIAEKILRYAAIRERNIITNSDIEKGFNSKDLL